MAFKTTLRFPGLLSLFTTTGQIPVRNMSLIKSKKWGCSSVTNQEFDVHNPANGSLITSVPNMNGEDTQRALETASRAFESWQNTTAKERSTLLRSWYDKLVENTEALAEIITSEAGKPLGEARAEVGYGNSFVEWFAEEAKRVRGEIIPR